MVSAAPTFVTPGRTASGDLAQLARLLPPSLLTATGDVGSRHEQVAKRYGEATAKVIATRRKLEEAQAADDLAAREAIVNGEQLPKAKADRAQVECEAAERELRLVTEVLPRSANELLAAAQPIAAQVSEEIEAQADELEQKALGLLDKARELLVESDALRDESAYAYDVAETRGHMRPWGTRSTRAGAGVVAVDEARRRVENEAQRRREWRDEAAHEQYAANVLNVDGTLRELPAPPGRTVS